MYAIRNGLTSIKPILVYEPNKTLHRHSCRNGKFEVFKSIEYALKKTIFKEM